MSETEKVLEANEEFARTSFPGNLPMPPARHLAILACMDARLDVNKLAGLKIGDAHVIRNAGGIATDDAIRSLIISNELLGTEEFVVINHTDCGMLTFEDKDLRKRLREKYRKSAAEIKFYSFKNLEDNVRRQVRTIKKHPFFPKDTPVSGFIYDVDTGRLKKVV